MNETTLTRIETKLDHISSEVSNLKGRFDEKLPTLISTESARLLLAEHRLSCQGSSPDKPARHQAKVIAAIIAISGAIVALMKFFII